MQHLLNVANIYAQDLQGAEHGSIIRALVKFAGLGRFRKPWVEHLSISG